MQATTFEPPIVVAARAISTRIGERETITRATLNAAMETAFGAANDTRRWTKRDSF